MKDYKRLIANIQQRTNPESLGLSGVKLFESSLPYSDVLKYIRYAMKGVEPEYTQRSKDAGERVKEHLKKTLSEVIYKYQGSVMTNTHIKGASDIDLLVICDKFYWYDHQSINDAIVVNYIDNKFTNSQIQKLQREIDTSSYSGNAIDDLRKNRIDSENTLIPIYKECDTSHSKAIKITNRHLNRDVDIVIASWYDNITSTCSALSKLD